jgi:hypothetical protein
MQCRTGRWLAVAVVGLLLAWTANVQAQGKALSGTWKWTVEFGGQTREQTLKLKLDGDKLTGAMLGRDGQEIPITNAKYKDGEFSFEVTRERQGQKFTTKYQGKIEGDTIKGKTEGMFGDQAFSREWEAKRAKDI